MGVNEFIANFIAAPIAVPCVGTISVLMLLRNIFADMKSDVIGNWVYALPANTINPTLSSPSLLISFSSISFDFCSRDTPLGLSDDEASIELDTSSATITSMPRTFTVSSFEPARGRAIMITMMSKANIITDIFIHGL